MDSVWHCPFCGLEAELSTVRRQRVVAALDPELPFGARALVLEMAACSNADCREVTAAVKMYPVAAGKVQASEDPLEGWPLIPSFDGRGVPEYVPDTVRREYDQACATRRASPSASATLARRCLSAMIQDFWDVKEKFLSDSIDALRDRIDEETFEAIDSVRNAGGLLLHMQKGTNLIHDASEEEVDALIGLIEYLIDEWYVTKHKRKQRLKRIKGLPARTSQKPRSTGTYGTLDGSEDRRAARESSQGSKRDASRAPEASSEKARVSKPDRPRITHEPDPTSLPPRLIPEPEPEPPPPPPSRAAPPPEVSRVPPPLPSKAPLPPPSVTGADPSEFDFESPFDHEPPELPPPRPPAPPARTSGAAPPPPPAAGSRVPRPPGDN